MEARGNFAKHASLSTLSSYSCKRQACCSFGTCMAVIQERFLSELKHSCRKRHVQAWHRWRVGETWQCWVSCNNGCSEKELRILHEFSKLAAITNTMARNDLRSHGKQLVDILNNNSWKLTGVDFFFTDTKPKLLHTLLALKQNKQRSINPSH